MGALRKGDRLLLADGGEAKVVGVEMRVAARGSTGFRTRNLEVGVGHTFHVRGTQSREVRYAFILVHNAGRPCGVVYAAFDKFGKLEYIGRTVNFARRAGEQWRQNSRVIRGLTETISYGRMRALEQALIDTRGLPQLSNRINGIAQRNLKHFADDLDWAYDWIRRNAGDWF